MISIMIDGRKILTREGDSILTVARRVGIEVPTLCYLKDLNEIGSCRMCLVEIDGREDLAAACNTPVADGMSICTNSERVRRARKANLELILSKHNVDCANCLRGGNCALQNLTNRMNTDGSMFGCEPLQQAWPQGFPLVRDASKCVTCLRCVSVCEKIQGMGVWKSDALGSVGVAGGSIEESDCTLCGQCVTHCPTGALVARDDTARAFAALADPDTVTVVQVAPAVRAAWAESFGIPRDEATPGLLAAALRRIGFDYVFDTDFSADLTIMEEGSELLARLREGGESPLPLFTSCCPGWVRFAKAKWPRFVDRLSTAKSPQQMFGAVVKTWFAEREGLDPRKVFCMSVMPCMAKKHECALENMASAGAGPDVDLSITTREMVRMLGELCIDPTALPEEDFDSLLGVGTGAGVIFGATGGVMEAALRSAFFLATGRNPDPDAFSGIRGSEGWREATFDLAGAPVRVAAVSGLENAGRLLAAIESGEARYDFVEVMACPGGCAGGGGQPICEGAELASARGGVLYGLDKSSEVRFSHENPSVLAAYKEYFGAPLSEKAHRLLHSDHHDWSMPHV